MTLDKAGTTLSEMKSMKLHECINIVAHDGRIYIYIDIIKVPNGWLYRISDGNNTSQTFVPEIL